MSEMRDKLIEIIATKAIAASSFGDLKLPEPFGTVRWTGWKERWDVAFGKHAQIVWYVPGASYRDGRVFYVDIPTMNHGTIKDGGLVNIEYGANSHHITEFTTLEEVRRWFVEGFNLLIDDVLTECPWLLEGALPERKG